MGDKNRAVWQPLEELQQEHTCCAGGLDEAMSPTALLGPPHSAVAKCVFNSYIAAEEAEAQRGLVTSPTHIDHTGCKW